MRVLGKRGLRGIFGPKGDEVTGEWRKLHNKELNPLLVEFKSLLHGQEGCIFFQWAFKFTYVPVRFSAFSPANDI
jgi:hypothetical protein